MSAFVFVFVIYRELPFFFRRALIRCANNIEFVITAG